MDWAPPSRTNSAFCCTLDQHSYSGRPKKKRHPPTHYKALKSKEEEVDCAIREIASCQTRPGMFLLSMFPNTKMARIPPLEEQQPPCKMFSNEVSPNDSAKPGTNCTLAELLLSATPDCRPSKAAVLSIDRMPYPFWISCVLFVNCSFTKL